MKKQLAALEHASDPAAFIFGVVCGAVVIGTLSVLYLSVAVWRQARQVDEIREAVSELNLAQRPRPCDTATINSDGTYICTSRLSAYEMNELNLYSQSIRATTTGIEVDFWRAPTPTEDLYRESQGRVTNMPWDTPTAKDKTK